MFRPAPQNQARFGPPGAGRYSAPPLPPAAAALLGGAAAAAPRRPLRHSWDPPRATSRRRASPACSPVACLFDASPGSTERGFLAPSHFSRLPEPLRSRDAERDAPHASSQAAVASKTCHHTKCKHALRRPHPNVQSITKCPIECQLPNRSPNVNRSPNAQCITRSASLYSTCLIQMHNGIAASHTYRYRQPKT